jgi:hypothetical protein
MTHEEAVDVLHAIFPLDKRTIAAVLVKHRGQMEGVRLPQSICALFPIALRFRRPRS